MYTATYWLDETDEFEDRYTETANQDGTITHTKVRGTVMVHGTPQNADNFNNLEYGVFDASLAASQIAIACRQNKWDIDSLDALIKLRTLTETGSKILTNTLEFPFNNSKSSVAIPTVRSYTDYEVVIISATAASGNVGEVIVSERQVNGFKLEYTGSASSVTVTYAVIGGNVA